MMECRRGPARAPMEYGAVLVPSGEWKTLVVTSARLTDDEQASQHLWKTTFRTGSLHKSASLMFLAASTVSRSVVVLAALIASSSMAASCSSDGGHFGLLKFFCCRPSILLFSATHELKKNVVYH